MEIDDLFAVGGGLVALQAGHDHLAGLRTPEVRIVVNEEASGMLASHAGETDHLLMDARFRVDHVTG